MNKLFFIGLMTFSAAATSATAQVAQGGVYKLDQTVIAAGSGTSADSTGNLYNLDGTIGEPVAGMTSSAGTYSLKGGFLSSPALAPTAANVSISGCVLTADGTGLINARVTLTDSLGNARTVLSKKLGAFRFDDVEAGVVYIITINSRRYTFAPQAVSVTENLTDVNFTAQESIVLQ